MARESLEAKALRYIRERRMTFDRIDAHSGLVIAHCRGGEGSYTLGWDPIKKEYRCDCLARTECAHIKILKMLVVRP